MKMKNTVIHALTWCLPLVASMPVQLMDAAESTVATSTSSLDQVASSLDQITNMPAFNRLDENKRLQSRTTAEPSSRSPPSQHLDRVYWSACRAKPKGILKTSSSFPSMKHRDRVPPVFKKQVFSPSNGRCVEELSPRRRSYSVNDDDDDDYLDSSPSMEGSTASFTDIVRSKMHSLFSSTPSLPTQNQPQIQLQKHSPTRTKHRKEASDDSDASEKARRKGSPRHNPAPEPTHTFCRWLEDSEGRPVVRKRIIPNRYQGTFLTEEEEARIMEAVTRQRQALIEAQNMDAIYPLSGFHQSDTAGVERESDGASQLQSHTATTMTKVNSETDTSNTSSTPKEEDEYAEEEKQRRRHWLRRMRQKFGVVWSSFMDALKRLWSWKRRSGGSTAGLD